MLLAAAWIVPCHADEATSASAAAGTVRANAAVTRPGAHPPSGWNWNYDFQTYVNDLRQPVTPTSPQRPYTLALARQHAQSIPLELALLIGGGLAVGISEWDWGTSGFRTRNEGWFGRNTLSGGADKLGHAYTAYVLSDLLTWRLQARGFNTYEAAITGAAISGLAMVAIEIGDGFSAQYGASYEDLVAGAAGIGFSFLRNTVPGLREKLDFRLQHIPTGRESILGAEDYSGKKFLLALKFAGFERLKHTPLHYLELHAGYFTRGFSTWERNAGVPRTRHPYVGVGLNVSEILFSAPAVRDTLAAAIGRNLLEYVQVPYTYIATDNRR